MIKDYLKNADTRDSEPTAQNAAPQVKKPNPMRELQNQYAKILTACYELYAEGKRCIYEEDPLKRFDCSNCEYKEADHFCRSNFFLKKLVKLIAQHLAEKIIEGRGEQSQKDSENDPPAPLTQEDIENFKARGIAYEIETPLCPEHIWLVPEHTDKDRVEFTPEEMNFLIQVADHFGGEFVEIVPGRGDKDGDAKESEGKG